MFADVKVLGFRDLENGDFILPSAKNKRENPAFEFSLCLGSGGRTRTYDLRVMSPTSYRTALSRDMQFLVLYYYSAKQSELQEIFSNFKKFFSCGGAADPRHK